MCTNMWHFTKQAYERYIYSQALIFPQTDEEWKDVLIMFKQEGIDAEMHFKQELNECKDKLLSILPDRFIPYLHNETINQPTLPKHIRTDFHHWQQQEAEMFNTLIKKTEQHFNTIQHKLPEKIAIVFEESLFDAIIEHSERQQNTLRLVLNTERGCISKARVILTFHDIISEDGSKPPLHHQYLLYHEFQLTETGMALRVITNYPDPWTIESQSITTQYYYRPLCYIELVEDTILPDISIESYIRSLNNTLCYFILTPTTVIPITQFTLDGNNIATLANGYIFSEGNQIFAHQNNQKLLLANDSLTFIDMIFTDIYETSSN